MKALSDSWQDNDRKSTRSGQLVELSRRKLRPTLSFVVPCYNEEENIATTILEVSKEANRLKLSFEIILVDDGSSDRTIDIGRAMMRDHPIRVVRLSRNFGKEQAISAGLSAVAGDATVILDADLQEPISYLETLVEHWKNGYEMVYAVRADRSDEPWFKRGAVRTFYGLLNCATSTRIPPNARDFRLMDRKVVDALVALPERNRFMKGLYSWVGFRTMEIAIDLRPRQGGTSKFGAKRLTGLALTGLTAFSDWPLRVWSGIGFVLAALSILYGIWIVLDTLIWGVKTPGWASLAGAIVFLGGVQLISIGVLGEYIARIFTEVKARPGHIVAETIDFRDENE